MNSAHTNPRATVDDPDIVVSANLASQPSTRPVTQAPRPLTVGDVMTTPAVTIEPDAPLLEVVHRLIDGGDEGLVVTVGLRPAGIVTARRLLALLTPEVAQWRPQRALDLVPSRSPRLLPDLSLATAARALLSGRHDALPVVDSHGDLIGVIGYRHLVAQFADDGCVP